MLQHPISEKPSNLPGSVPETPKPAWKRHLVRWSFIVLAIAALGYWHFRGPGHSAPSGGAPGNGRGAFRPGAGVVPVVATPVVQKDLPIYLEGLGTVQALNTVTIRPRVDGQLVQVAFTEGQLVKAGDVLAKIDPAPFLATLAQAEAKKRQDEATLANARLDLARYAEMLPRKATSQQAYDTQKALVAQDEAAVSADEASVQSARVQLAYTTLTSPIEGRVGLRQIDQGNIIYSSGTTGLVEVTQLHPITVIFTLPQQNLPAVREEMAKAPLPVVAVDRNDGPALGNGTLSVFDNAIDSTTGTIKLKAVFPNDDLKLWPGQFVNARLLLSTRKNAVVVPAAVIQRGPNGEFAFVITKGSGANGHGHGGHGDKPAAAPSPSAASSGGAAPGAGGPELSVEVRPVKVALIQDGQALIDSGLAPGEQVVLEGQYRLQANSRVRLEKSARAADAEAEQ